MDLSFRISQDAVRSEISKSVKIASTRRTVFTYRNPEYGYGFFISDLTGCCEIRNLNILRNHLYCIYKPYILTGTRLFSEYVCSP